MIWIIGGTKDSRDILEIIIKNTNESIIITTATGYGGKLLEDYVENNKDRDIRILSEKLDENQMEQLIKENGVTLAVDASHPYAQIVSKSVINVTNKLGVKYVRFERKMLDYGTENVIKFETLEAMNEYVKTLEGVNILSTFGSNNLAAIKEMGDKNNLYVRMLPTTDSIKKAEDLGYLPSKIIAIQGPIDKILNKAMLQSYKINYLLTKESGTTGGEQEKVEACKEEGVTVLVLTRPFVNYGTVFNELSEVENYFKNRK